ncbi:MAG TPA: DUF2169 domain-containing protein, partial [Byssovorax sp.]
MFFVNATPLQTTAVPNAEEGDDVAVLVVTAITCKLGAGDDVTAPLTLAKVQRPLVLGMGGEVPGDDVFVRKGASLTVTGYVHASATDPTRGEARVVVEAARTERDRRGSDAPLLDRRVAAFGARVWRRGALGVLTATSPLPFTTIPMTWRNAFGGSFLRPAELRREHGRDTYVP